MLILPVVFACLRAQPSSGEHAPVASPSSAFHEHEGAHHVEERCFSIVTADRALDLEAHDKSERDAWVLALQVRAMSVISVWGRMETRIEAARLDPGSYRIQLLVASSLRRRGRCREAVEFARRAASLLPEAAEPQALLRACASR